MQKATVQIRYAAPTMSSNINKNLFLGMSHGTACNKLRKLILFKLVQQTQQNTCFRCGQPIEEVEQLSIEHKQPWEGISVELFWDLNNIAFSHLSCNIRAARNGAIKRRKVGPQGTAWCADCNGFKPLSEFHSNKNHWDGKQKYCILHKKPRRNGSLKVLGVGNA